MYPDLSPSLSHLTPPISSASPRSALYVAAFGCSLSSISNPAQVESYQYQDENAVYWTFSDTFFTQGECQPLGTSDLPSGTTCSEDTHCASGYCIIDGTDTLGVCATLAPSDAPTLSPTYSPSSFPTAGTITLETSSPVAPATPAPSPSPTSGSGGGNIGSPGTAGQSKDNKTNTATIIGLR